MGQENLTEKQEATLAEVFDFKVETAKAGGYKEMLRELWGHSEAASATTDFKEWYRRVIHTKLKPMKKVVKTIQQRLDNVVSYCTHGITNPLAERLNSKIMSIKRRVGGY